MKLDCDSITVGDKMKFSTELLEKIEFNPRRVQTCVVLKITEDVLDGTKTVYLGVIAKGQKRIVGV